MAAYGLASMCMTVPTLAIPAASGKTHCKPTTDSVLIDNGVCKLAHLFDAHIILEFCLHGITLVL